MHDIITRAIGPLTLLTLSLFAPHVGASPSSELEPPGLSGSRDTPVSLRCLATRAPDLARLELLGAPRERVLLTLGLEPDCSAEWPGRRLAPLETRHVELDPNGRAELLLRRGKRPVFAQAWRPASSSAAHPRGHWSTLCVAYPSAGTLASTAGAGDLVITEFLKDPTAVADSKGEWVEVKNLLPWRLDISGVILSDASGAAFVFDNAGAPLYLRPGQSFVFGAEADPAQNGGVILDWEWSGFSLRNSSDEIYLHDQSGVLLDAVEYDDGVLWPDTPGRSISLDPTFTSPLENDSPGVWCHSVTPFGTGDDTGTPGLNNDSCQ